MRAEYLAGALTAKGKSYDDVGRSTKPHDARAAYLARVSTQAMDYANVVYFGEDTENNIRKVYRNVLLRVMDNWQPIGTQPEGAEAIMRWKKKNAHLIEKLTRMVIRELMDSTVGQPNRAQWRAQQIGVTERRWHQAYRERYDRISAILTDWDGEFRGKVYVNQKELRAAE